MSETKQTSAEISATVSVGVILVCETNDNYASMVTKI